MRRGYRPADMSAKRDITREEKALGAIVDEVHHEKSGVKIPVRLDKATMTFGAFVAGVSLTDKDGAALRKKVIEAIETSVKVDWIPIIIVRHELEDNTHYGRAGDPDSDEEAESDGSISIRLKRYFVGLVGPGNWRSISWKIGSSSKGDKVADSRQWYPPGPSDKAVETLALKLQAEYTADRVKNPKMRGRYFDEFSREAKRKLSDGFKLPHIDEIDREKRGII